MRTRSWNPNLWPRVGVFHVAPATDDAAASYGILLRRLRNQFENEEAERSLRRAFIRNVWGNGLMQSPEHCRRRAQKLRLALLMTDDTNAAARLRMLMEKYRARALV
jgi:hypothetical protein